MQWELELAGKGVADVLATADKDGWTPLLLACKYSSPAVIYSLLSAGADARGVNRDDSTCLHVLCGRRVLCESPPSSELAMFILVMPQLMAEVVQRGCKVNARNSNGETALHVACSTSNLAAAAFLLTVAKVDPSAATKKGLTPLDYALHARCAPLCQMLLKYGASAAGSLELAQQLQLGEAILAMLRAASEKIQTQEDVVVWDEQSRERPPSLQGAWDVFRTVIYLKCFYVFVCNACKICVVSLQPGRLGEHLALLIESNTFTPLTLQSYQLKLYQDAGVTDLSDQMRRLIWTLTPLLPEEQWRLASGPCVVQGAHLLALEAKLCPRQAVSVGVILGRGAQRTEEEMMAANRGLTRPFERFLNVLEGPDRVPGLALQGCHWRGFYFTFNVGPLLAVQEQRSAVGNASVLLFFCEDDACPLPAFRGSVNSAALVATYCKKDDRIRFSGFHKRWIEDFDPAPTADRFHLEEQGGAIRRLVFINLANSLWAQSAASNGPYSAARSRQFDTAIAEFIRLESDDFQVNKRTSIDRGKEGGDAQEQGSNSGLVGVTSITSGDGDDALRTSMGAMGVALGGASGGAEITRGIWLRKLVLSSGASSSQQQRHFVQWDAMNMGLCVYKAEEQDPNAKLLFLPVWAVSVSEFEGRLSIRSISGDTHEFVNDERGTHGLAQIRAAFKDAILGQADKTSYHEGWLLKKKDDRVLASWKRRWFVVTPTEAQYYKQPDSKEPIGALSFASVDIALSPDSAAVLEVRDRKSGAAHTLTVAPDTGDSIRVWLGAMSAAQTMLR